MPTVAVQDYVKQVYHLQRGRAAGLMVPMGELARAVGVTPGTATTMVKGLTRRKLVRYEPRGGVRLTRRGETMALAMLRRHRLIELFLVDVLKLDWAEVHDEAERLEHAVSEKVLDRLDELLGRPSADPHGSPIPTAAGRIDNPVTLTLAQCQPGQALTLRQVPGRDMALLAYLTQQGLTPGTQAVVTGRDEPGQTLRLRVAGQRTTTTMSLHVAAKLGVEPMTPGSEAPRE